MYMYIYMLAQQEAAVDLGNSEHCGDSIRSSNRTTPPPPTAGTQFTCFTSTKVQILTPDELVQQHSHHVASLKSLVYLLYWYKRTNTDT
jgi:hypothetical protein